MGYEINHSELYRQIKFYLHNSNTPPRFIYAREPGSKAPYRFRIPIGHKKYEHRLLKGLRSRGLNPRVWSPTAKSQPSHWQQSIWPDVLRDLVNLFSSRYLGA